MREGAGPFYLRVCGIEKPAEHTVEKGTDATDRGVGEYGECCMRSRAKERTLGALPPRRTIREKGIGLSGDGEFKISRARDIRESVLGFYRARESELHKRAMLAHGLLESRGIDSRRLHS